MENDLGLMMMVLTGISLAMDAFAVSISCGLSCAQRDNTQQTAFKVALSFGFFQGIMTLIGWAFGLSFRDLISQYDHWVAFTLLVILGGKMLYDAVKGSECSVELDSPKMLLTLSIATSIDALAVGVSFSMLSISLNNISTTSIIIALITFGFCFLGTHMGAKIGCNPKTKSKIDSIGGLILIFLGVKILLESTLLI